MTNEKTDNTDEPTKAELHERVEQLESTVEKLMPSRRDALRMGAAGLAGAAGLGAASQSADASTGSAGTIGSTSDRPDLLADDVETRSIADDYLYAGAFSGSSPDARLDNAITAANNGDAIYLEAAAYNSSLSINKRLVLIGTSGHFINGTVIQGDITWTINKQCQLHRVPIETNTVDFVALDVQSADFRYTNSRCKSRAGVNVNGSNCIFTGLRSVKITFNSSTSDGIVDACATTAVNDNGSNVIGDNS